MSPLYKAISPLEQALVDIARATDAKGLKILLLRGNPPREWDFRLAIERLATGLAAAVWIDPNGEENAAQNLELLVRGWRAYLEAAKGGKDPYADQ